MREVPSTRPTPTSVSVSVSAQLPNHTDEKAYHHPRDMRRFAVLLLALAAAAAAGADDGFSLGLVALPLDALAAAGEDALLPATGDMKVELVDNSRDALVFRASFTPSSESEYRLALWNSPMGRLYYDRAEAEAMRPRGAGPRGHSLGVGMALLRLATPPPRPSASWSTEPSGRSSARPRSSRSRPRLVRGGDPLRLVELAD